MFKKTIFLMTLAGVMLTGCKDFDCCMPSVIKVTPPTIELTNIGDSDLFDVTSSLTWVVTGMEPWMSIDPATFGGTTTVTVKITQANTDATARTAKLTFMAANGDKATATVIQHPSTTLGETLVYDGSDPSMLQTDPMGWSSNSLFPTSSLTENQVTVETGAGTISFVFGGITAGNETVSDNTVTIEDGNIQQVMGGYSEDGDVTGNSITVNGGTVTESILGGSTNGSGTVSNNTVTITGGNVADVVGGNSFYGDATGNEVTISGGTVTGSILGGQSITGVTTGNTVNLIGGEPALDLSAAYIYVGMNSGGNSLIGNVLNVSTTDITAPLEVAWISNFETINFILPNDIADGDTMLYVNDGAYFDGTSVITITLNSAHTLTSGDIVILIDVDTKGGTILNLVGTKVITASDGTVFDVYIDGNGNLVAEMQ